MPDTQSPTQSLKSLVSALVTKIIMTEGQKGLEETTAYISQFLSEEEMEDWHFISSRIAAIALGPPQKGADDAP